MKPFAGFLLAAGTACLSACAWPSLQGEAPSHKVQVSGQSYALSQITASTWTVTTSGAAQALPTGLPTRSALLQAVEQTSGCKVTDSDYSRGGSQLDAQVDCGNRLKN